MNDPIAYMWDDNDGFGGSPNPKLGFDYPQHIKNKATPLFPSNVNFRDGVLAAIKVIESSMPPDTTPWDCVEILIQRLLPDHVQPTVEELKLAMNAVFASTNKTSAIVDLRVLRSRKHTWIGKEENDLRFKIDGLLYAAAQEGV